VRSRRGQSHRRLIRGLCLAVIVAIGPAGSWAQEYELSDQERQQLGQPQGIALAGEALTSRAREVGSLLRCPVCQGLSVFDSPVPAAQAMQKKVELLLEAGYSEQQVLTYFETSYGEFVRLSPKPEGFNLVVWILPIVAILLGVAIVARRVRGVAVAEEEADLEAYRQRVREDLQQ
jgi:cytochrome c-type biogenesis protein CcmH